MFSAKVLLFLMTSAFFLQCTSQEKQLHLRGTPEVDYPTYYSIPKTSFQCSDQLYNPGFYADVETRCQVFHYCYEHRRESFLCPMGTIFNQPLLACDYWYSSNCSLAPSYYNANAVKRNEFFDEVDDPQDSQSHSLFDKMADLYELNETSEPPIRQIDSDTSKNVLVSIDGMDSSSEPLVENSDIEDDYNKYKYDTQFNMIDEKQPKIVKYDVISLNAVNDHKDSTEEQTETERQDFVFSEDGTLHRSQEDIYGMYPTDMNFDQGYSGYAEIPSEGNFNYDLNEDFDSGSDFRIPDLEFQKRYSDINGNYVRPSNRKPIIIPEVEPEIVQLPVTKRKRKPIGIVSTVGLNADRETSYETTVYSNIYKEEPVSEDLAVAASSEFPLDETNSNHNYNFNDPNSYENQEEENILQLHQMEKSNVIYDYSDEKRTLNAHVFSNVDEGELSSNIFGSGSDDLIGISNVDHRTLTESTVGDEGSIELPGESSSIIVKNGNSFSSEEFLGSGSEGNILPHSGDGSSFSEDQDMFSDGEDTEIIDMDASYALPMDLLNTFEGSGISVQEAADMPNFAEKVNEPIQFALKDYSEGNTEYFREPSFHSGTLEKFSPSESLDDNAGAEFELNDVSTELNYLPNKLQGSFEDTEDSSDKNFLSQIREIDGAYYVFSDSEYHSNLGFDSSGVYSENVHHAVTENFENLDETSAEFINSERYQYATEGPKLKTDYMEDETLFPLDDQGYRVSEKGYEKLLDEIDTETSSQIPGEEYEVEDSNIPKQFSAEDLKFLEVMSQTPFPMLNNLVEVSQESTSGAIKKETPHVEIISSEQNSIDKTQEELVTSEKVNEFVGSFSDASDAEENAADMMSSGIHSEILGAEQKIPEEDPNMDESDQDGTEASLPQQDFEVSDPFNPLFLESDEILDGPESKQKISLNITPVEPKNASANPVTRKDLKKVSRGMRLSEHLRTFNPPNKGNPLMSPSKEASRGSVLTSIPSEFLKMKHSTLRPYFYNYGIKNSEFNPRTGNLFESSKFSKLTSFGRMLLAAKSAKFNKMRKYMDTYRNN